MLSLGGSACLPFHTQGAPGQSPCPPAGIPGNQFPLPQCCLWCHIFDAVPAFSQAVEQIEVHWAPGSQPEWRHCPLIEVDRTQKKHFRPGHNSIPAMPVSLQTNTWKNQFRDAYFYQFVLI